MAKRRISSHPEFKDELIFTDYFKDGDYYKGMSAYSCTVLKHSLFTGNKENYSEIVRLVDGKVLIRAWESGKIEEFIPTALTKEQLNTYKNSSYGQMLEKLK